MAPSPILAVTSYGPDPVLELRDMVARCGALFDWVIGEHEVVPASVTAVA